MTKKIESKNSFYHLYENTESQKNDIIAKIFTDYSDPKITDYHFEPLKDKVILKIRYSGMLKEVMEFTPQIYKTIINRFLIYSELDVIMDSYNADSSFEYKGNNFRISFMESHSGISCVLRKLRNIEDIEIEIDNNLMEKINDQINLKTKALIFSGPTGSGKSTTMSYIVNRLVNKMKIHTIENPIEFKIDGAIQIPVEDDSKNCEIFKYILRQDPELIVVGEIREHNFAKLLFDSASTGHTVFASIHSANVFNTLTRLKSLGVDNLKIASSIDLIINQRLEAKKCHECMGKGCEKCYNTGKSGYFNIFEGLFLNHDVKGDILKGKDEIYLRDKYKNTEIYYSPLLNLEKYLKGNYINEIEYKRIIDSF